MDDAEAASKARSSSIYTDITNKIAEHKNLITTDAQKRQSDLDELRKTLQDEIHNLSAVPSDQQKRMQQQIDDLVQQFKDSRPGSEATPITIQDDDPRMAAIAQLPGELQLKMKRHAAHLNDEFTRGLQDHKKAQASLIENSIKEAIGNQANFIESSRLAELIRERYRVMNEEMEEDRRQHQERLRAIEEERRNIGRPNNDEDYYNRRPIQVMRAELADPIASGSAKPPDDPNRKEGPPTGTPVTNLGMNKSAIEQKRKEDEEKQKAAEAIASKMDQALAAISAKRKRLDDEEETKRKEHEKETEKIAQLSELENQMRLNMNKVQVEAGKQHVTNIQHLGGEETMKDNAVKEVVSKMMPEARLAAAKEIALDGSTSALPTPIQGVDALGNPRLEVNMTPGNEPSIADEIYRRKEEESMAREREQLAARAAMPAPPIPPARIGAMINASRNRSLNREERSRSNSRDRSLLGNYRRTAPVSTTGAMRQEEPRNRSPIRSPTREDRRVTRSGRSRTRSPSALQRQQRELAMREPNRTAQAHANVINAVRKGVGDIVVPDEKAGVPLIKIGKEKTSHGLEKHIFDSPILNTPREIVTNGQNIPDLKNKDLTAEEQKRLWKEKNSHSAIPRVSNQRAISNPVEAAIVKKTEGLIKEAMDGDRAHADAELMANRHDENPYSAKTFLDPPHNPVGTTVNKSQDSFGVKPGNPLKIQAESNAPKSKFNRPEPSSISSRTRSKIPMVSRNGKNIEVVKNKIKKAYESGIALNRNADKDESRRMRANAGQYHHMDEDGRGEARQTNTGRVIGGGKIHHGSGLSLSQRIRNKNYSENMSQGDDNDEFFDAEDPMDTPVSGGFNTGGQAEVDVGGAGDIGDETGSGLKYQQTTYDPISHRFNYEVGDGLKGRSKIGDILSHIQPPEDNPNGLAVGLTKVHPEIRDKIASHIIHNRTFPHEQLNENIEHIANKFGQLQPGREPLDHHHKVLDNLAYNHPNEHIQELASRWKQNSHTTPLHIGEDNHVYFYNNTDKKKYPLHTEAHDVMDMIGKGLSLKQNIPNIHTPYAMRMLMEHTGHDVNKFPSLRNETAKLPAVLLPHPRHKDMIIEAYSRDDPPEYDD